MPSDLIWSDEFNGAAGTSPSGSNWTAEQGGNGWGNNELQSYTNRPQNVSHDGAGNLAITARKETYTGPDGNTRGYTSARIHTKGKFSFTYGRLEARIRIPAGQGLWPAFWGLGDDVWDVGWPNCGEIDVMEALGNNPEPDPRQHPRPDRDDPDAVGPRPHLHRPELARHRLPRLRRQLGSRLLRVDARRAGLLALHQGRPPGRRPVAVRQELPPPAEHGRRRQLARRP